MSLFKLHSKYSPAGGQEDAINKLVKGYGVFSKQTLLGITGSGKSLDYHEEIIIKTKEGFIKKIKIGEYVEKNLSNNSIKLKNTKFENINTYEKVLSFNPKTNKIEEKLITQISIHKEKEIFEITLDDNSIINITADHNCYVLDNCNLKLKKTKELKIGDSLPLSTNLPENQNYITHINLTKYNQHLNVNLYPILKDFSPKNKEKFKIFLSKYYKSPSFKLKAILSQTKERGIKINILNEFIQKFNISEKNLEKICFVGRNGKDTLQIKINLTKEFLYFLGLYVSEGHYCKGRIIISNSENLIQKKCIELNKGYNISYTKHNKNDISYYSQPFTEFFIKEFGTHSYNKKVSDIIFNIKSEKIKYFLQGIFDGDGWVEDNSVHLVSASKELISDLKYLLLKFNIITRISLKIVKEKKYFQINISGRDNLEKFKKNIDFTIKYKKDKLKKTIKENPNTNTDLIPNSSDFIKRIRKKYNLYQKDLSKIIGCEQSYISMIENNQRQISKNLFEKLIRWLIIKDKKYEDLLNLLKFNFRQIKEIKKKNSSNGFVYDIAVKDNENFMAGIGGIFVHNTFIMANIIEKIGKPTLILAHNKTLAAQLYQEIKEFFPQNHVEYFISYYDYYQPESYIPTSDTYIEKEATINQQIEKMRLKTLANLISHKDVIVVASISCIYGAGDPEDYKDLSYTLKVGEEIQRNDFLIKLVDMLYQRNDSILEEGKFRVRGDTIDVYLSYDDIIVRIEMFGDEIEQIYEIDPITNEKIKEYQEYTFSPAKQFAVTEDKMKIAIEKIKAELDEHAPKLNLLEEQRIKQRVKYDIEMMQEMGYCTGIENYSRHFENRKPGTPPKVLLDYFPEDFTLIIDESHQTIPQSHGMYKGDYARKKNLIDFGFRLPSAYDNRPLKFEEFEKYFNHTIFVSATPAEYEIEKSGQVVEVIIRPTGLLDPEIEIRPIDGQIKNLLEEIKKTTKNNQRVLVTTLTKKMAEDITNYFAKEQIKVRYLHSDIDSLDRIELIRDLRAGEFDVLVGINLLREGLDIPEVSLVAILDADKEGFLRNERSLIQTIGRAARNENGKVIMYADKITKSIKAAVDKTKYRRKKQIEYNKKHNIIPKTVIKQVNEKKREIKGTKHLAKEDIEKKIIQLEADMKKAAQDLDFEKAIKLRETIKELKK